MGLHTRAEPALCTNRKGELLDGAAGSCQPGGVEVDTIEISLCNITGRQERRAVIGGSPAVFRQIAREAPELQTTDAPVGDSVIVSLLD
jgi:hypothetical protein